MRDIETIYENQNGRIIHGDNLEVLATFEPDSFDNCTSDFPYDLTFMGRSWDNTGNFYEWCLQRALALYRVLKPGGYVAIFGHPKTNHRMKCAFEDAGFKIVEEIDWIYLSGFPKNQDIGKLFDKAVGAKREVIGTKGLHSFSTTRAAKNHGVLGLDERTFDEADKLTAPSSDLAKKWNGWKTSGLKPAHEPITIFQKPLEGKYINNLEKHGCGAMNIDACRVPYKSENDISTVKAKCKFTVNSKSIGFGTTDSIYGTGSTPLEQARQCVNEVGRFPANIILDEYTAELLDEQTGISQSRKGNPRQALVKNDIPLMNSKNVQVNCEYDDIGGGSRMFTVIKYNQKVSPKERLLPNGERNPHVTLKPVELIKWLIKLLTPINGTTIDITAGSCTHAVAVEQLNKNDEYNLKWVDIELTNTEEEPYCDTGKTRLENM